MEFWVKLIQVNNTSCEDARKDLYANCTHVINDYWLFEGDEDALHFGINFQIVDEQAIGGTGDLNTIELIELVRENYDVSLP